MTKVTEQSTDKRMSIAQESLAEKIVLIEYQRTIDFEQGYEELIWKKLQFYFTVLTGGVGLLAFLYEQSSPQPPDPYVTLLVLGMVAVIGLFIFAGITTADLYLYDVSRRREVIQQRLAGLPQEARRYLGRPILSGQVITEYSYWASLRGIVKRALSFGGTKTLIRICNGIICGILCGIIVESVSSNTIVIVLSSVGGCLVLVALQVVYARIRYHIGLSPRQDKQQPTGA